MQVQSVHTLAKSIVDRRVASTRSRIVRQLQPRRLVVSSATETATRTTKKEAIKEARDDVRELIKSRHCNPILVRVAWHDSGTFDKVGKRLYNMCHTTVAYRHQSFVRGRAAAPLLQRLRN